MLLVLLLGLGVGSGMTSARSIYPQVSFPRIAVIAERGEAPVRGMLIEVTRPIELAVTAPGLLRMRSKTVRGAAEFSLDFSESTDMEQALSYVRARIVQAGLPSDVRLTIEQQTPAVFPVISFSVVPGAAVADDAVARARLAEWTELELAPRLSRLPDAFRVTVQSGDQREFRFEPDPLALASARVDVRQVVDAIRAANVVAAVGRAAVEGLQYQLLVDGRLSDPEQVLDLAVPRTDQDPVPLRALGRIVETVAERTMVVTGGGGDGVVVSVFLRDDGRVTDLSTDVKRILDETAAAIPAGGRFVPVYDQAQLVLASIAGVRDAIGIGALLSVLVMALFLGNWRLTVVAGLAIPVSVAITIGVFPLHAESLNLMSLGGLAVAIGLIIDDSIVVVENVARRLAAAPERLFQAVAEGTIEVFGAIVGSSLTTVVVFLPLVLLPGVVGQFFRSLSLSLGISIVVSMVVSLVYVPLLLLTKTFAPVGGVPVRRMMERVQDGYAKLVAAALRHGRVVMLVLGTILLAGAGATVGLPTGFLPEMDEGGFVLDYALPVGSGLRETDAVCRRIEAVLLETPEVASLSRRTGAELGFFATEQFTGDMLIGLRPHAARKRSVFEVIDELRERFAHEVPQAEIEFVQVMQDTIADLAGNPSPIEVRVHGADYPQLQEFANAVHARLETVPGLADVKNHVSFGSPELTWRPDPIAAARLGLDTTTIAAEVTAQLLGEVATKVQQGDRFVDLRVRYAPRWRAEGAIEGTGPPVFLPASRGDAPLDRVPLARIATFTRSVAENELERENQVPMVRVTAAVAGTDLGAASRAVAAALASLPRPAGVHFEIGGQVESQAAAFRSLLLVFALGGGLVFLLLVVQFRSLRLPLVIFLALPFGQIGGLLALRWCGVALNVSSGMGLIMLVGLVVKNGIILIEHAQQRRREGLTEVDAVIAAARVRLRPILMTTLAAIAGLVPLALGLGSGAELQRPLAIVVIGGLIASTAFALLVVPLGCCLLARGGLLPDADHAHG